MEKSGLKKILAGISALCVMGSALPIVGASAVQADAADKIIYGDANEDGEVKLNDAVLIMQALSNPSKFDIQGTDEKHISATGRDLADVNARGDGLTGKDALSIQKYMLKLIDSLPESWTDQPGDDTTTTTTGTTSGTTTTTTGSGVTTTTTETPDPQASITYIHLKNTSISVEGDYAEVNGTTVTITHSGQFIVDGTLDDGQINVNIPDETADAETVKIFLNGVSITGKSAPAILITNAENTSINLIDGSENTISDGDTAYSGDYLGAAVIEAKDDLTIKGGDAGTGILNLTANTQDGIVCNNDIKITGGVVNVTTLNATDKTNGINGKTSLTVKGGTLTVDAEGDGIKSGNGAVAVEAGSVEIKAGNDAIQAETTIDISGGTVLAGGDRGLTAATGVNITGGTVVATATDNQVAAVTSANQATMLLNCIDSAETDLMWKKANAIKVGNVNIEKWAKKYKYVLISDASITAGKSYTLTNASTGATVTYNNDAADSFNVTNSVTTFDNVNPAGKDGSTTVVTPTTDGYTITLSSSGIATNAPESVASVSNNVLTIKQEGTFAVTGENTGSQIVVDVDSTTYPNSVVELDLMGMSLTNTNTAPIYVASIGDEVQIVAKSGTTNTISDGTTHSQTYTDSDGNVNTVEGAIFARDDIKFKGTGTLNVNGNQDDAIVCKNDIKIYNGTINVTAVDDGIRGKDSVTIGDTTKSDGSAADNSGINLTVKTSSGDGIKSTATDTATDKEYGVVTINGGTVNVTSYADGIQGEQAVVINGGDINVKTTGASGNMSGTDISAKGIKAVGLYDAAGTTYQSAGELTVNGGMITVDSKDDSLHCSGTLLLNAGKLKLTSGDDAVHSDSKLYVGGMTAGTDYTSLEVYVTACYEGFEAEYIYQNNGNIYVISSDDGYNSAGGADSSGNTSTGGWSQGGGPGGMGGMGGGSYGEMHLNGGIVSVNTSFNDADGFDSNGPVYFNGGYYFGNGGDSFDCGDGYSITYNGGYAFGGLGMGGGNSYDMSTQMVFTSSNGTVLASSMSGSAMSYAYGDSSVLAYSGAQITGGTNISTLGQPAVYVSGTATGGTAKTLGQSSSSGQNPWNPWG